MLVLLPLNFRQDREPSPVLMGIDNAYNYMSAYLCQKYEDNFGKAYLFTNECVAYEIEYHVDAYMRAQGYKQYRRNITTYVFSKQCLIDHCKTVDISTKDVENLKQSIMFRYKKGVRAEYKNTANDPYSKPISLGWTTFWLRY